MLIACFNLLTFTEKAREDFGKMINYISPPAIAANSLLRKQKHISLCIVSNTFKGVIYNYAELQIKMITCTSLILHL